MNRCLKEKRTRRGYTLMEVLVVVGIIAVIAAIAIPSVISMRKSMEYRQRCDYAKTIFLAAQSNLAELRSTGELKRVEVSDDTYGAKRQIDDAEKAVAEDGTTTGNIPVGFESRYIITANNNGTADDRYAVVLPVNAVESTIRDQNVIIEYNARTGIVHGVFYAEGDDDLLGNYQTGRLSRKAEWLKNEGIGYYGKGEGNVSDELGFKTVSPEIDFVNDQEAILTVKIPTRTSESTDDLFFEPTRYGYYVKGLEINLTVAGENSGVFTKTLKEAGVEMQPGDIDADEGAALMISLSFPLDSLVENGGFYDIPENKNGSSYHVLPGDNVSLFVEVSYVPIASTDPLILFDDAVLAGVNPLFYALTGEAGDYTVAIANGRHLQNLNALDSAIAADVRTVTFVDAEDQTSGEPVIDWAETVEYYNSVTRTSGNLTNFVPVQNDFLFNRTADKALLIQGDDVEIRNLKISDSTASAYVGLFRELNGVTVQDLRIVNPVIRGGSSQNNQKGAGALAGAISNSLVSGCYVYADVADDNFNWSHLNNTDSFAMNNSEQLIGVKGCAAVGGMVGYSSNTTFTSSFASVPVYGDMTASGVNANAFGVGGFAGAAKESTFTICYSGARTLGASATDGDGNIYAACGIGGFVGTSEDASYKNCFASGNVTSISASSQTLEAAGGFVGVAIDNGTKGNGIFNTCYSLGSVKCSQLGDNRQAKFVGYNYSSGITNNGQSADFYKYLLDTTLSSDKVLNYRYTYKDCYYLSGIKGSESVDTCALPASYDMLLELGVVTYDDRVQHIVSTLTADEKYTFLATTPKVLTEQDAFKANMDAFGFYTYWTRGRATQDIHYPYNELYWKNSTNYPFMLQKIGMPFYGFWPEPTSDVGVAYVEYYVGDNGSIIQGLYYEPHDINTLQNRKVVADSYIILSAKNSSYCDVSFNGETDELSFTNSLTLKDEFGVSHEYYYAVVPATVGLYKNTEDSFNSFYTCAVMNDGVKTYTMFFNPNVAASQKRASTGSMTETEKTEILQDVPKQILIRSPRQLTALASDAMKPFWDKDYVLFGNLDFDSYGISTTNEAIQESFGEYGISAQKFTAIGTVADSKNDIKEEPFTGTMTGYTNAALEISGATIKVTGATTGLIGNLGTNGKISNITLTGTMDLDGDAGALVNVMNGGTLENCTVNAVITAEGDNKNSVGLVVGAFNGGTISNCHFDDTGIEATEPTSTHLGFVGTAAKSSGQTVISTELYYSITRYDSGFYDPEDVIVDQVEKEKIITKYSGAITDDCGYKISEIHDEKQPAVQNICYYYSIADTDSYRAAENPAAAFVAESGITLDRFGMETADWKETDYYFQIAGRYVPVSVKVTVDTTVVAEPSEASETESAEGSEEEQESTETTAPTEVNTYTYQFAYSLNGNYMPLSGEKVTEDPASFPITDMTLYSLDMPDVGQTCILVDSAGKVLTAGGAVDVTNDGITGDMVWTVGADNKWSIDEGEAVEVVLEESANGFTQYPSFVIGDGENQAYYQAYVVAMTTDREVKLVDRDSSYSTTDTSDDA